MGKYFKNEKGFTLLESVISIAALAVLSIFILQMFIVSSSANEKAKNMDRASAEAVSIIELFKSYDSVTNFVKDDFFEDCEIKQTEQGYIIEKTNNSTFMTTIVSLDENGKTSAGELYVINVKYNDISQNINIYKDKDDIKSGTLVEYNTKKYFSY